MLFDNARAVELRPYQVDVIAEYDRAVAAGTRRIILVAPTGSGKTIVGAAIIAEAVKRYQNVLVIGHRREIISQTSRKLHDHGIRHGIIQAEFENLLRPMEAVQVASIQTLHARAVRSESMKLPPAHLLIVDECQHAPALTYKKIIDAYPDAILLGLTATPCRGDGRGLGGIFETIIECPQVAELISDGFLVKTRVYAPVTPNLRGVTVRNGDYAENELADRMDRDKLVGDIVTHWHRYGERRRTVAFACSVGHSIHITEEFVKAGVKAEHLDGSTPKPDRDAILKRLETGETELVSNCMVLTEGWDMPEVGCCILARPTKKMGLFRQMIGRVLRPAEGKPDAIILDHSGAVFKHGLPEDRVEWLLDADRRAVAPAHQARLNRDAPKLLECTQCSALRVGGQPCPACGFLPQRPAQYVPHIEGDLALVNAATRQATSNGYDPATRQQWHGMLAVIASERGYKPGWVAHKYKEKFNAWPPWGARPQSIEPTPEVRSWVRSRQIAFAKRQSAA
jgi:superfamily II DNA or RNA helicase